MSGGTPRHEIAERVASAAAETAHDELHRRAAHRLDDDGIDELVHAIQHSIETSVNGRLKLEAVEKYDHDIVSDGGTIPVCPSCGSARYHPVVGDNHVAPSEYDYYCRDCETTFDDLDSREPDQETFRRGLAGRLDDLDADAVSADDDDEIVTDGGETPLDRLFVDDTKNRPDAIVADELTTLDADEFVARLESVAEASQAVTTIATDLERLRETGLSDDDARDLIYGRNAGLAKRDIEALFDAIDEIADGRADRPTERLLAAIADLTLSETSELLDELDRLHSQYGIEGGDA
jgi:hypothetical protein